MLKSNQLYRVEKFILIFFTVVLFSFSSKAQQRNIPLEKVILNRIEIYASDSTSHLSLQPYLESDFDLTRVLGYAKDSTKYYYRGVKKIVSENLISINREDFQLIVNPVLNLEIGRDFANQKDLEKNKNLTRNTRGFQIKGNITNKFSFETSFYENQAVVPLYLDSILRETQVFPGQGRIKFSPYNRKLDYAFSEAYISYSPSKYINLQFGHGKHFIGNGYRSILLSDCAFNYPYLRARVNIFKNKVQYATLFASLQSLERLPLGDSPESTFKRKSMTIHYLSWVPNKFFEVGVFESMIWKRYDNVEGTLPYNYLQLNPIPFVNTLIYGLSDKNNASLGANLLIKPFAQFWLYGQFLIDDIEKKKTAHQIGFKFLNLVKELSFFAEWNHSEAYTYATTEKLQNYTQYNQSLAHPLGSGFNELFLGANYRIKKVYFSASFSFSDYYSNYNGLPVKSINFGSNILLSDDEFPNTYSRFKSKLSNQSLKISYLINPRTNFQIYIGYLGRNLRDRSTTQNTSYAFGGISTTIFNNYYDF